MFLETLLFKKDHRDKEYILFCFLKPCFWPTSPPKKEGKKEELRPTYSYHLPTTTSAYHYLPLPASFSHSLPATWLPLPATTCHYLPLPATYLPLTCHLPATTSTCHLPIPASVSTCHYLLYLPPPATTCHCLPLSVTTCLPATTSLCHHLQLPAISCHNLSPDPVAEIATSQNVQQTRIPNNHQNFPLEDTFKQISSILSFFETLVFDQRHLPKR